MQRQIRGQFYLLVLFASALSACGFIPALPARDPGPTATPLVTEGIAGSTALAYNLGTATITQSWSAESPEMPVPLLGTISIPSGDGPFPLALVLHDRHTRCYSDDAQLEEVWPCPEGTEPRYDIGFSYLLDALSAQGYLAVAPSVNGAYTSTNDLGQGSLDEVQPHVDERMVQITQAHLAQLASANDGRPVFAGGLDLTGKVDLANIYTVAHSTSGVTANLIARDNLLPVRGQLLLTSMNFSTTGATADVPTLVLLSACDGDRPDLPGQIYYESARRASRGGLLFSTMLSGANHNFYNQVLGRQGIDDGLFSRNPACLTGRITAEEQQAFLGQLSVEFFDSIARPDQRASWLDIMAQVPRELFGRPVITALSPPADQRRTLLSGAAAIEGPVQAELCVQGEVCADGLFQPGFPDGVRLSWNGAGGVFSLQTDGITESFDGLRLRAALDPTSALNNPDTPLTFSVVLTDTSGNSAAMELPESLPFPPEGTYEGDDFRFSPVMPMEFRWPLSDFAGVDVQALESAAIRFDATEQGAIVLVDFDLVRGP